MKWRTLPRPSWGALLALVAASGGGAGTEGFPTRTRSSMTIRLTSPAFADGGMIPKDYTCDGADRSPPLEWTGRSVSRPVRWRSSVTTPTPRGHLVALGPLQSPARVRSLREGLARTIPSGW